MTSSANRKRRPIGVDLFAGAGGMSLGFEQAGFDVAAAVEIDPIHAATHAFNFPKCTTICASVVGLSGNEIWQRARLGNSQIDVVFGGAPCQGFSMIGKRALDDPRNGLVFHFVRLVSELRPRYFVFENVKGLTLGAHVQLLKEFIEAMGKAGYEVVLPYRVLNAAHYGVPQNRHRLFVIGARKGEPLPQYPSPHNKKVTVSEAIEDLPDADKFDELLEFDAVSAKWKAKHAYAKVLHGELVDEADFSYPRMYDSRLLTSSLRTIHTPLSKRRFLATVCGDTEPVSRFHKLDPNGQCNTIRAGTDSARGAFTSPRPIHPHQPRVITVREAARLHSYPDWFRFHSTKWHGFRQIGNSVPPLLARAIGASLIEAMSLKPIRPNQSQSLGDPDWLLFDMGQAAKYFRVARNVIAQRQRKSEPATLFDWRANEKNKRTSAA